MTPKGSFASVLALMIAMFLLPAFASLLWAEEEGYDYEGTMAELQEAHAWYKKRNYDKARAMVDKLKDKVFGKSDTGGLEYPTSITLGIKYLDKLLKDREGYFRRLSSFTGIAEVVYEFNTGMFRVKGKKETLTFTYERDVLILGDADFHGRKITVYYDGIMRYGTYDALKIVVHQ